MHHSLKLKRSMRFFSWCPPFCTFINNFLTSCEVVWKSGIQCNVLEMLSFKWYALFCVAINSIENSWNFHLQFSTSIVLETYTLFVNNVNRAKSTIRAACNQRPAFARFLENMAREHKGKLTLDNLLIKPVQKFPKWVFSINLLFSIRIHHFKYSSSATNWCFKDWLSIPTMNIPIKKRYKKLWNWCMTFCCIWIVKNVKRWKMTNEKQPFANLK